MRFFALMEKDTGKFIDLIQDEEYVKEYLKHNENVCSLERRPLFKVAPITETFVLLTKTGDVFINYTHQKEDAERFVSENFNVYFKRFDIQEDKNEIY